jgi:hypothetical protein
MLPGLDALEEQLEEMRAQTALNSSACAMLMALEDWRLHREAATLDDGSSEPKKLGPRVDVLERCLHRFEWSRASAESACRAARSLSSSGHGIERRAAQDSWDVEQLAFDLLEFETEIRLLLEPLKEALEAAKRLQVAGDAET